MGSAMVRVSDHTREALREIAHAEADSMQSVLEKAVEQYRRKRLFEQLDAAYASLQEDPEAWQSRKTNEKSGRHPGRWTGSRGELG